MVKETRTNVQVVIGFAESFSAPEVVWSLIASGFPVMTFARKGSRAAVRASRYTQVFDVTPPEEDAAATIHDLSEQTSRLLQLGNSRLVLLPLDDAAFWVFRQIPAHGRLVVVGPTDSGSALALDKELQVSLAREAGFRVPETVVIRDVRCPGGADPGFPMILKPARAISLRDGRLIKHRFHSCSTKADLVSAMRHCAPGEPMLAQRYVSGAGEGLFGLATQRGVFAWSGHRRLRMMNPLGSGASACVSASPDAVDIAAAEKLIERTSWRGPFMIELLRDDEGTTWFMEFNGRVWGSTALARRCGLEYPAWAISDAIGQGDAIPSSARAPGGVVCRHAGREAVHALFVLRGPRSRVLGKWPSRWKTLKQLFRFKRGEHWYNWKRDDWRVFVRDFAATVAEVVFKKRRLKQP